MPIRNSLKKKFRKIFGTRSAKQADELSREIMKSVSAMSDASSVSTSSSSSSLVTKRVSFQHPVDIRSTLHANDMTSDEVVQTWYSKKELEAIGKNLKKEMNTPVAKEEFEIRGLESSSKRNFEERHNNVYSAMRLVMNEQAFQHMTGTYDPEAIRLAYAKISTKCQAAARKLGQENEFFVIPMNGAQKGGDRKSTL